MSKSLAMVVLAFGVLLNSGCSSAVFAPISGVITTLQNYFGDTSDELIQIRGVHLDALGLLNQNVRVAGEVISIGKFQTFAILEEDDVRLLVDLSKLPSEAFKIKIQMGSQIEITGKVQTAQNGRAYMIASSIRSS